MSADKLKYLLCTFLISRRFEAAAVIRFIYMEFPSLPIRTNLFDCIVDLAFLTCPGIASASTRNEYQEYLLWGKGGLWVELTTLKPSGNDCIEILGVSNLLKP